MVDGDATRVAKEDHVSRLPHDAMELIEIAAGDLDQLPARFTIVPELAVREDPRSLLTARIHRVCLGAAPPRARQRVRHRRADLPFRHREHLLGVTTRLLASRFGLQ